MGTSVSVGCANMGELCASLGGVRALCLDKSLGVCAFGVCV